MFSGLLIINKPAGPTSHDIVAAVRKKLGVAKAGHCGTLDPAAEGILLVLVGSATKLQRHFLEMKKTYHALIRFGLRTDTYDACGIITSSVDASDIREEDYISALAKFKGDIIQKPPAYSAVRYKRRRLYELARNKEGHIPLPPRCVTVHELSPLSFSPPYAKLRIICSKGTYIRSLARDLGEELGCGAILNSLVRESIGPYGLASALSWDSFKTMDAGGLSASLIPEERVNIKEELKAVL